MTALPLCIIGAGLIGLRHIEVCAASDAVRLTAVVEPHPATREKLLQQGLPAVADLDDVPGDTAAAIIATPTPDHAPTALRCIARGWAVLVEKPIAGCLADARKMTTAANTAGVPLITGHHRRCHPFTRAAGAAIADIGAPVGVQGFWSLRKPDAYYQLDWRRLPGAGPLMTNLSHEIDLLHVLMGEITEVTALVSSARRTMVIEDTAAIALRFASGALGSFLISDAGASPWSFEAASGENPGIAASGQDYLRVTGTTGALEFPSLTRWAQSAPGEVEWSKPMAPSPAAAFARIDPLLEQLNRFAKVAGGGSDDVLCSGAAGTASLEMTLAVILSAQRATPVQKGQVPGDFTGA
ncbi:MULTISPECIES: Gfo/Idh/MocA family protein [unclassified Marinovum]